MCGIAGIFSANQQVVASDTLLSSMAKQLHHRGPDDAGFYTDASIALVHTRLSIIDIAGGKQPIHNENKNIWVVFNGEIFNYIELREELKSQGHIFYTHSDTEVIVHLYEQYGQDFVQHLNGQFAIALWDAKKKTLLLVRDRIGIHPLFYCQEDGSTVFASEIKAIIPALKSRPSLNLVAIDQLMTFWSPVSPNTAFENIYEVSPGEMLTINASGVNKSKYWDWHFPTDNNSYHAGSTQELAEQLRSLLIDATKIRLRSDVPVGAYLSGGLDSSVLTALIHNFSDVPLRTFSIGFDDKGMDESSYQQQMIQHIGADHSSIQCKNRDIAENFLQTIWHTEAPILRTAPVPMRMLSGLVRQNDYKVVLTGEGSDEVLGGYDIFKEEKIRQFWAKNPASEMRPRLLKKLYPYLDISKSNSRAYLEAFFGMGIDEPNALHFSHIPRWTTTAKCKEFFSDDMKGALKEGALDAMYASFPQDMSQWHSFNRAQYVEAKSLMGGYLLCSQGDRMLMANSVEGRFPFLDHNVIEFANKLDPRLKMKVLNEKYLLKQAMKDLLPESIVNRYKQPYRAPDIAAFFGEGYEAEYVSDLLSSERLKNYGYFDDKKVARLLNKIRKGRAISYKDNMSLVGMLSTQALHYLHIEDGSRDLPI